MGVFRFIAAARALTVATAVALAMMSIGEATAAEGPALLPAEYKPLPVGTNIIYDKRTDTITRSDGYTTVLKRRVGEKAATYVGLHAGFGEHGTDIYATLERVPNDFTLIDNSEKKLETLWPLAVGKETSYQVEDTKAYYSPSQIWTVTLKVAGTETLDLGGRTFETFVVNEQAVSDIGMSFRGRKWYHPASGLIVRTRRIGTGLEKTSYSVNQKIANLDKDEVEEITLRNVEFPPGTAAEVVAAAQGTIAAGPDKVVLAEVERLKHQAQETHQMLEAMKARQADEQRARHARMAELDREMEDRRKAGAQQTDQGARELKEREAEIARLRKEAEQREREAEADQERLAVEARAREAEIAKLKQEADRALKAREAEIAKLKQEAEIAAKSREAEIARLKQTLVERPVAKAAEASDAGAAFSGIEFGRYHALVIGIDGYRELPKLKTAIRDARAVAEVLERDYSFSVTLLIEPDRLKIMDTLDGYREQLGPKDNLLIYYAGHGWLDKEVDRGYWLPVDAQPKRRGQWISNATITDTLKALSAKHVMVIADSCYSGTLVRGADVGTRTRTGDYWKRMAEKWARVAITSGGTEPVADAGGGGHSPFAKAFIDALSENTSVMDGTKLFSQMRRPVMTAAQQTPQYADVREAGHDGGDFLFVRKKK